MKNDIVLFKNDITTFLASLITMDDFLITADKNNLTLIPTKDFDKVGLVADLQQFGINPDYIAINGVSLYEDQLPALL